jgi:hypothetical protein
MTRRTPSPYEAVVQPDGTGTRPFLAFLEDLRKQQAAQAARLEALIAHLEAETIIGAGWDE